MANTESIMIILFAGLSARLSDWWSWVSSQPVREKRKCNQTIYIILVIIRANYHWSVLKANQAIYIHIDMGSEPFASRILLIFLRKNKIVSELEILKEQNKMTPSSKNGTIDGTREVDRFTETSALWNDGRQLFKNALKADLATFRKVFELVTRSTKTSTQGIIFPNQTPTKSKHHHQSKCAHLSCS
jgi:hypothetical protein